MKSNKEEVKIEEQSKKDEKKSKEKDDKHNKKTKKIVLSIVISFVIIAILVAVCFLFFIPNVNLLGKQVITIKLNEEYKDKGVKATYQGKDISKEVQKKGKVNNQKVGTYEISYKVKKGLFEVEKIRTIRVIDDIAPEIILTGDTEVTICPGKKYEEAGFTVTDNYDGDLTNKVKIKETEENITYTVIDSSGNKKTANRNFIRTDI